jgi:Serine/threonine protein kinase
MPPSTDAARRVLGRYRLIELIASGGSAEVWRAHDEQLDRAVAVKLLHPHLLPDERSRQRFAAEARAIAALAHPRIAAIYDVAASEEQPALVLELVDGEALATRLRRGPLAARDAARVAAEMAEGLLHAHERGVVHRDVKPGNILLDGEGHAHLVDFGIAHSLAESVERLTLTGTVMGTLRYMAPEQLSDGRIGPKTDLYALGVVLFEMLTGRAPFVASSPVGLADAQRSGQLSMPGVHPGLAAVTRACLSFEPDDRPRHAGVIAVALRAWLDGDGAPAMALAPFSGDDVTETSPVVPSAAAPARRSRRRLLVVVAALAAAALIGLTAFAMLSGLNRPAVVLGPPSATASMKPSATPSVSVVPTEKPQPGKGHGHPPKKGH